jgi:aldose 1-epimerase
MARQTLQVGGLRLTLDPELGGAITSLTHDGEDLLRPTPEGATDVLQTACFPLVPYANRIADGRFSFGGRTAALSRNMAGQAHPLHGDGWRGAWQVEARGPDFVSLAFEPETTEWPWRYRASQAFRLRPDSLTVELAVTNLDDAPGPFGLGFHPYFPHSATARLTARTTGIWRSSADLLPVELAPAAPWADGAAVRTEELVDHCHTGWAGPARIDLGSDRRSLELTASPELGWLHVFAPPGEDFFCVEPVSHAPNAVNMADPAANGVRVLAPGQTFSAWMRFDLCER